MKLSFEIEEVDVRKRHLGFDFPTEPTEDEIRGAFALATEAAVRCVHGAGKEPAPVVSVAPGHPML